MNHEAPPPPSQRSSSGHIRGFVWRAAVTLAVLAGVCAAAALLTPHEWRERIYAGEGSIIEWVSLVQWALLALVLPLVLGRMSLGVAAWMVVFLACAAREADLHKALTGYSVLKPKFYFSAEYPAHHRLIAALIVALIACAAIVALRKVLQHAARDGWLRARWVRLFALAVVLGVMSKAVDRAPAMAQDLGMTVSPAAHEIAKAFEENAEVLLPLLFLGAAVAFRIAHKPQRAAHTEEMRH